MSYTYEARGVSVHDGRTARLRLSFPPTGLSLEVDVVLAGIDVPELIGPERELGLRAQAALQELLVGHDVQVSLSAAAIPGRALEASIVRLEGADFIDLAERMIALGLAREPSSPRQPFE